MAPLRPLIIVNNHNSATIVQICAAIADRGHAIMPLFACEPAMLQKARAAWGDRAGEFIAWGEKKAGNRNRKPTQLSRLQKLKALANRLSARPLGRSLVEFAKRTSPVQYAHERLIRANIRAARRTAEDIIMTFQPSVILAMSDRSHDYMEASLLVEARRIGIPVVLPYVAHYDIEFALGYRRDTRTGRVLADHSAFVKPSLYKFWSWLRLSRHNYKGYFFQAPQLMNAHRKEGTLSAYPWWVGHGPSDIACVNSRHMHDMYRAHGVKESKIALTGDISYDALFRVTQTRDELRARMLAKYGMAPHRRIVAVSMPQFAEQGFFSPERHWVEIEKLVQALVATGENILISLHPRVTPEEYAWLTEKYPCHIAQERLAEFLPIADVFVAQFSSTVVWAALCKIPSVIINLYDWHIDFYDYLTSVTVVASQAALGPAIAEILSQPVDFAHDWKELSRDEVFDGKTAERYWKLFQSVRL